MKFSKYHALGNDYIVIEPRDLEHPLDGDVIQRICHRNFGVGSDGILFGPVEGNGCDFGVRIFNPDGSEAEKSGNGIRIFSRYLLDRKLVGNAPFTIWTEGGVVTSEILDGSGNIQVDMGKVRFDSQDIPVTGPPREVIREPMEIDGQKLEFTGVTVGNPHCVIIRDDISEETTRKLGPFIETDARFPNRINVQFMKVIDRNNVRIEIWERGAGYTLASGSSSTAAAATAFRLGLCDDDISVHMQGGILNVRFSGDFMARLTGPVTRICDGEIFPEMFGRLPRSG